MRFRHFLVKDNDFGIDTKSIKRNIMKFQEQSETQDDNISNELILKSDKLKSFLKEYFDNTISAVENALTNISKNDESTVR